MKGQYGHPFFPLTICLLSELENDNKMKVKEKETCKHPRHRLQDRISYSPPVMRSSNHERTSSRKVKMM